MFTGKQIPMVGHQVIVNYDKKGNGQYKRYEGEVVPVCKALAHRTNLVCIKMENGEYKQFNLDKNVSIESVAVSI
jgi:hypothetical protein